MSKRLVPLFVAPIVVLLFCLAAWSIAQQNSSAPKTPESGPARFAISANGDSAVLLETATGKTWVLRNSSHAHPVWMPVRRLDSEDEVRDWAEQTRRAEREARDAELKRQLTPEAFERLKRE